MKTKTTAEERDLLNLWHFVHATDLDVVQPDGHRFSLGSESCWNVWDWDPKSRGLVAVIRGKVWVAPNKEPDEMPHEVIKRFGLPRGNFGYDGFIDQIDPEQLDARRLNPDLVLPPTAEDSLDDHLQVVDSYVYKSDYPE